MNCAPTLKREMLKPIRRAAICRASGRNSLRPATFRNRIYEMMR